MEGITVEHMTFKRKERFIFNDLSITIPKGQFISLLGPNGTGKSTFLKILNGLIKAEGSISIDGQRLSQFTPKQLAKKISYMPQSTELDMDFTVEQIVKMGRYPHKSRFAKWTCKDAQHIEEAIALTRIDHLRERFVPSLSGGERQLVYLAKMIAQNTDYILLDEPTSDLDIYHQEQVTSVIQTLVAQGKTVFAAIHDINFSTRVCDQTMLLKDGVIVDFGHSEHVLTPYNIATTFAVHAHVYKEQLTQTKQMIPLQLTCTEQQK